MVSLSDSPKDRQARRDALVVIARRVSVALGIYALGGLLAWGLGVPGWIVIVAGIVILALVLTTT